MTDDGSRWMGNNCHGHDFKPFKKRTRTTLIDCLGTLIILPNTNVYGTCFAHSLRRRDRAGRPSAGNADASRPNRLHCGLRAGHAPAPLGDVCTNGRAAAVLPTVVDVDVDVVVVVVLVAAVVAVVVAAVTCCCLGRRQR